MAYDVIDGVFVVVHGKPAPNDEEWDEYLAFYRDNKKCRQMLVVTDGGGPNAKQRAKTNEHTKDTAMRVAVCTDVTVVYGIVTALSWFNSEMKVFAKSRIGDAFTYLKVDQKAADNIKAKLPVMRLKIVT